MILTIHSELLTIWITNNLPFINCKRVIIIYTLSIKCLDVYVAGKIHLQMYSV